MAAGSGGVTPFIFGVSENVFNVKANDDVVEVDDLVQNPLGFNGYLLHTNTVTPFEARTQPVNLRGVDADAVLPIAGGSATMISDAVGEFLVKWGAVQYRDGGQLKGYVPDSFVLSKMFKMH